MDNREYLKDDEMVVTFANDDEDNMVVLIFTRDKTFTETFSRTEEYYHKQVEKIIHSLMIL